MNRSLTAPLGRRRWRPGELPGRGAVADGELVEPATSRISLRPVEAGDVRLEVDDRGAVQQIDAGEHHGLAGHLEKLDKAEPDRVDPPRSPGGENAHRALLTAEQERDLPQWCVPAAVPRAVQPAEQPGVVEVREPVQAVSVRLGDLDRAVLGSVETGLDRRALQVLVAAADHSDHRHADGQLHQVLREGTAAFRRQRNRVPSLLLPCYADGACILVLWSGRWRFRQAGCMTWDCTWSGARSTAGASWAARAGAGCGNRSTSRPPSTGGGSWPARSCPTTCTCS